MCVGACVYVLQQWYGDSEQEAIILADDDKREKREKEQIDVYHHFLPMCSLSFVSLSLLPLVFFLSSLFDCQATKRDKTKTNKHENKKEKENGNGHRVFSNM
jgi:hypothetical protein